MSPNLQFLAGLVTFNDKNPQWETLIFVQCNTNDPAYKPVVLNEPALRKNGEPALTEYGDLQRSTVLLL